MKDKYQFESFTELSSQVVAEMRELEFECNKLDGTRYQLFLENTLNADRNMEFVYLYRVNGQLVSFLLLFFPSIDEIEFYGFTHHEFRRRGLFHSLVENAKKILKKYDNPSFLFVCDPESADGMAYLIKQNTIHVGTEYMMELNWQHFNSYIEEFQSDIQPVELRIGLMDHLDEINSISETMYDDKIKSIDFAKRNILADNREQLIGVLNNRVIGICTIGSEENFMMINGLAIAKEYRGRGYGRLLLNLVISYVKENYGGILKLEVSNNNDKAFSLYKSVGFEKKESYGYFK